MLNVSQLVIEVTRKCNMLCGHCLRGDIENIDLQKKYIDTLLEQVENIGEVTFTGGEPSLNVPIIDYFLEQVKDRNICVGGFYIATNGKKINEDFIMCCLRLYSYCDEKEMCNVHVSNDYYHQLEGSYSTELLDGLSFFNRKFDVEGYNYDNDRNLISQGRSEEMGVGSGLTINELVTKDDFNNEGMIYLNCNGDIVNGCDLSYTTQDEYILCTVDNLTEYYEGLKD